MLLGRYNGSGEMQVLIELPDDVSEALKVRVGDVSLHALEALAVEGYRSGTLSESQIRRMMGYESRVEVHGLLKRHRVPYRYTKDDVADDLAAHADLGVVEGR